jgi:hypothetical protein
MKAPQHAPRNSATPRAVLALAAAIVICGCAGTAGDAGATYRPAVKH